MRISRVAIAFACLFIFAGSLAGCGGDSSSSSSATSADVAAPPTSDFPPATGKTLGQVLDQASGPSDLVVSPAGQVFYKGKSRYSFGVFGKDRTPVNDAKVAIYIAPVPKSESRTKGPDQPASKDAMAKALDQKAAGPFTARIESLATKPAFRAQTTSNDPLAATAVYVTDVDFPADGEWRIAALVKDGSDLTGTLLPSAIVGQFEGIPRVGDHTPSIHTPTAQDVGGDLSKITTRIPPDTQNETDFFDALGKKPIVLLFATPQFCQSRVCGPVVDETEQLKEQYGDQVEFIHVEIYTDNDPNNDVLPQVRAFNLPSEPWLFVIDKQGKVTTAIEGAFGLTELEDAVKGVAGS